MQDPYKPAWCPGCGNFQIREALLKAIEKKGLRPNQIAIVSGIGQGAKMPHYIPCNTFNGLHGRSLPVATALKAVNHKLVVIAEAGDGDIYGEGGNHLIHAMRRNPDISLFVHNNQIYGLTKGQASPTSVRDLKTKTQPFGLLSEPLNPVLLGVAMNASFVGRGFSGDVERLSELMVQAMDHKGFALLDILQPCVTFNRVNTFAWYKKRVYYLEDHDPFDRKSAFERAMEWGERIPLGVIFKAKRPTFEEGIPFLRRGPLVEQGFDLERVKGALLGKEEGPGG
ncbi:MAG: thiamine pyrophosphate-dependent enzyme [Desulfatiglandales bacterium]